MLVGLARRATTFATRPARGIIMSASQLKRPREDAPEPSPASLPWVVDPTAVIKSTAIGAGRPDPRATTLVIYHGPHCPDGFGAAFAAWKLLGDSATYVAAGHGKDAPRALDVTGQHVAVLDYAFPAEETQRMISEAASFICVDHHASAEAALAGVPDENKVFEMRQSGATLAYNYFHPGEEVPLLFRYVEDKDIWRWAHRDSRAFTAGWDSVPLEFGAWDAVLRAGEAGVEAVLARGRAVLEFKVTQVDRAVSQAVLIRMRTPGFGEWVGAVVNASVQASEIGNAICQRVPGAAFALIWNYDHASRVFRCSLRSDSDEVDVSALARVLGGGGHRRAAGFGHSGPSIEDLFEYVPQPATTAGGEA